MLSQSSLHLGPFLSIYGCMRTGSSPLTPDFVSTESSLLPRSFTQLDSSLFLWGMTTSEPFSFVLDSVRIGLVLLLHGSLQLGPLFWSTVCLVWDFCLWHWTVPYQEAHSLSAALCIWVPSCSYTELAVQDLLCLC